MRFNKFNLRFAPAEAEAEAAAVPAEATASEPATEDDAQTSETDIISALSERFQQHDIDHSPSDPDSADEAEVEEEETGDNPEAQLEEESEESEEDTEEETEESEEEDPEDTEEESEEEDTEEEEEKFSLKDLPREQRERVQEIINQRVGKITAKQKTAQAEAEKATKLAETHEARAKSLEAQVNELAASKIVPAPTRDNPLTTLTTDDALKELEQQAWQFKQWAIQNPDGGECPLFPGKDGEPSQLSAEKTRQMLATVEADLGRHIPQRRAFLKTNAEYDKVATQAFPDLADSKSEFSQAVNSVLRAVPELKAIPGHKLGAAYYEIGRRIFEKHQGNTMQVVSSLLEAKPAAKKESRLQPKKGKVQARPVPAARRPAATRNRPSATRSGSETMSEDDVINALSERLG